MEKRAKESARKQNVAYNFGIRHVRLPQKNTHTRSLILLIFQ